MKKHWKNDGAVSSVVGVILMVGMVVIMVSVVAISVMGFALPDIAPQAKIAIVEAKGDIDDSLYKNQIILRHKGGEALVENYTKIIINGRGYAYTGDSAGVPLKDIRVTYRDLIGENYYHNGTGYDNKEIVTGTSWDAGETITLYGRDGIDLDHTDNRNNVDYKWKLDAGTTVTVTIIDTTTNEVITVLQTTVK